jgi:hypothetical protein
VSTPLPNDPTTAKLDGAISTTVNSGVTAVETLALTLKPWLGWPVVKQIWEGIFQWIAGLFVQVAETGETFAVIDNQTGTEVTGMSTALANLLAAEKSGDQNAINAAIQAYATANSALVRSDGATPVGK